MQVYELALQQGLRPVDLIARADAVGLVGLTPSTDLTPAQVGQVCVAIGLPRPVAAGPFYAPPAPYGLPGASAPPGWAPPPEGVPRPSAPSAPSGAGGRGAIAVVVVMGIVLAVSAFAILMLGGGSDDGESAASTTEPMQRTEGTLAAPPISAPLQPSFGLHRGAPAPVDDLSRFCAADVAFSFALSEVYDVEARNPMERADYQDALAAWFSGRSEYPAAAADEMLASFGSRPASDEAITLHELGVAVAAQVDGGGAEVQSLVEDWSDRFVTALNAVDGDYTRSC